MDHLSRRLLEIFEGEGRDLLDVSALAARAGMAPESDALRAALEDLARRGFLRRGDLRDRFARTEEGRLALAGPRDVTLYTRPGCHLCDEAKQAMAPVLLEFGARLREVNIDLDPVLYARYSNDVPVIFLGSRKVAKHRLDARQFRRQLEQIRP
jgi:glutaredoxin